MDTATKDKYMEFVEKVAADSDLTLRLAEIRPGDRAGVLSLAASQGYDFTPAELEEAAREASLNSGDGELSEEELEQVSGGKPKAHPKKVIIVIIAILIA